MRAPPLACHLGIHPKRASQFDAIAVGQPMAGAARAPEHGGGGLIDRLVRNQALRAGQNQRLAQRRPTGDAQQAGFDPGLGDPGNLDVDGIDGRLGHGVQLPG